METKQISTSSAKIKTVAYAVLAIYFLIELAQNGFQFGQWMKAHL